MLTIKDFEPFYKKQGDIAYLTDDDIQRLMGSSMYAAFCKWFIGQTGIIADNGDLGIYPCDVENFLHKVKTGKELFFD